MWVFREQGQFSSFVNLDVLDVGFQRVMNFSALLNLDALDVAFQRARRNFKLCEHGCARCGFSESAGTFQLF